MSLVAGGLQSGGGTAVALAPGATGSDLTLSGTSTALEFISTQINGADGFSANNNGARWHIGTGTTDYLESDGTTISTGATGVNFAALKGKLIGAAASNAAQIQLLDTTNTQSFYFIIANTVMTLYNNAVAAVVVFDSVAKSTALAGPLILSSYTDDSATPGNRTVNTVRGKNAVAIGATAAVITNSFVTTASQVAVTLESTDATALYLRSVVPAAGSFTVNLGPANATAAVVFSWTVIK